ncbi:fucose mutarotase-like [Watersipora subatra]|uniref:fucose mutarotase-like n=1 Tax=Watersipora subatra TaxID=2589382 RepID=UPI00355B912D
MPLKRIPVILSPELLKILCEMGHGDTIVFADAHFPTSSLCKHSGAKEIRMDGNCIPEILNGVLELFPLDRYVLAPVTLMQVVPPDVGKVIPTIWDAYKEIVKRSEPDAGVQMLERFDFYEAAKNAYAIVHTGETSQYGNIILKKGVVLPEPPTNDNNSHYKSGSRKRPADSGGNSEAALKKESSLQS